MAQPNTGSLPLLGGLLATVAASLCCVGPLVLLLIGVSGAWIGQLAALEPYQPFFLALAFILLALAYRRIFVPAAGAACAPGRRCARPRGQRVYKALFALAAALLGIAAGFPYLAPLFY